MAFLSGLTFVVHGHGFGLGRLPMEPFLVTLQGPLVPISRY